MYSIEIFQNRAKLRHCLQIFYRASPTALENATFNSVPSLLFMQQPGLLLLRSSVCVPYINYGGAYIKSLAILISTIFLAIFPGNHAARILHSPLLSKPILVTGQMIPSVSFYCSHLSFYWYVYCEENAFHPLTLLTINNSLRGQG